MSCTLVVPEFKPIPIWWPRLVSNSIHSVCIGEKGEKGVIMVPSKRGFVYDSFGLQWRLHAFRFSFSKFYQYNVCRENVIFLSYSQEPDIKVDFDQIDDRLAELDDRMAASAIYKRKESLQNIFIAFLRKSGCESLAACTLDAIKRFLVWKD